LRVAAEAALAVLAVDLGRVLGAHDAHALGLELLLPVRAEALEHLGQRRDDAPLDETVQLLDHFVDALADEGLDRLGVDRSLLDVAVVELLLALLEAGQPRVAVDGRQWTSFSKIASGAHYKRADRARAGPIGDLEGRAMLAGHEGKRAPWE
jgi:hypothetical protein